MERFEVAARIAADSVPLADWALCHVRLMDDRRYPWLLLLPRRAGLEEWTDLEPGEQAELAREIGRAGAALGETVPFDKLNVAAIGNIVRQLHVHVVGRRIGDPAWPGTVWGQGTREPYAPAERDDLVAALRRRLDPA